MTKTMKLDDETHRQLMQWKLDYDLKRIGTVVRALVRYALRDDHSLMAYYKELRKEAEKQ